jgi:hypothetical protein
MKSFARIFANIQINFLVFALPKQRNLGAAQVFTGAHARAGILAPESLAA